MNILILTTSFPSRKPEYIGGKFVLLEAIAYAKNGANVSVLTPAGPTDINDEYDHKNLSIKRVNYFFPKSLQKLVTLTDPLYDSKNLLIKILNLPFFVLFYLLNVLFHARRVDIIHCQWTPTALFAFPARLLWGCKVVVTPRGSDIRLLPTWINKIIFKNVDGSIDCYGPQEWNQNIKKTFDSNYIKLPLITEEPFKDKIPEDLEGIFKAKSPKAFKIVYLGRIDETKANINYLPILLLPEAIKKTKEMGKEIVLVYIGEGNLFEKLKTKIESQNLESDIFLLGTKVKPEEYIPFFDIGIGGVNLNGVSQEFAINEIVQIQPKFTAENSDNIWTDRKNALLFEPNNLDDLINTIMFAYSNPNAMSTLKEKGIPFISPFIKTPQAGGIEYLHSFKKLLQHEK